MLTLHSIAIELTPRCNQRCVYCYNAWRGQAEVGDELTGEAICRLIDRVLADAQLEHVTLTGGEPFLREDLFDIIDHVNARGLAVAIISNGGALDERSAEMLAQRDVAYVQVTFAGCDADMHDALCGGGTFDAAVRAVAMLCAAGVAVGGSVLCTHHNFAATAATLAVMYEAGIRYHFAFNRFNPSGQAASHLRQLLPTRSEVLSALRAADRFAGAHDLTIHCTMPIPHCMLDEEVNPNVSFGQCSAGTDQAEYAVDCRGRLKLCPLQKQSIGSLLETPLSDLLAGGAAERFRAAIPAFCEPCPYREGCLGGCGAAAEWIFGQADELDPFLAQHVMVGYAKRVDHDQNQQSRRRGPV